jgi:hypothetical protein
VTGTSVTFAVASGGGTVNPTTAILTDVNGLATVTSWTLGITAGANTLTATSAGLAGSPVTFTATGVAGPATQIAVNAGNGQSAQAGTAVAVAPSVIVRDALNNPVAGVSVTFAVTGGGGTVAPTTAVTTNALGIATTTNWTLGPAIGANTLTATSTPVLTGSPVSFTATGTAGAPNKLGFGIQPANATAAPSTIPTFTVLIQDANGNTVTTATTAVTIAVGANPGASTIGGTLTVNAVAGVATFSTVTLNKSGTGYTLTAAATGLTGMTSAAFNVTAGAANKVVFAQQPSNVAAGAAMTPAVTAQIQDVNGNLLTTSTASVTMAIGTNPGGSVLGGTTSVAAVGGVATFSNLILNKVGTGYTLTAASTGLTGATSSTFNVTPGPAATITISAGNGQSATAGTAVAVAPAVLVTDLNGNPVTGVNVTFAVALGGGTVNPTTAIATSASGIAAVTSWTLGSIAGTNTLTATSAGLSGSPLTFTATGTVGAASQIAVNAGNAQTAVAGTAVPILPSVLVRDAGNNPVAGVAVTFAVVSGNGSVTGASTTTTASGIATVGSWTLGTTAGANSLSATATGAGITGNPVTFTATGTPGTAAKLGFGVQPSNVAAGSSITPAVTVAIQDANGNTVTGATNSITVAIGANPGSSTLGGTLTASPVSGVATFSNLTLNKAGTGYTLTASSNPVLTGATSTGFNVTAGAATTLTIAAGQSQTATVGTAVAIDPSVLVTDANGNPKSGVSVTFAVTAGSGTVVPTTAILTDANGLATVTSWTLGSTAGTNNNTLSATSAGLTGSPAVFTASATAAGGSKLAITTQPSTTAQSGVTFAAQPVIQLQDNLGNNVAIAGVIVSASIQTGGGTLNGTTTATTDANGTATFTNLSISGTVGSRTLLFGAAGYSGVASNSISITAGPASTISLTAGNNQTATVNTNVATAPSVVVRDAASNPVSGVNVTFAVTGGGGTVVPTTAIATNASGVATVTSWTLGTTAGTNTMTATSGSLSGSPVTFTATGVAGAATQIAVSAGNGQSATVGTAVAIDPAVVVRDAFSNPVSGVNVTFAVTGGGGTVVPTTAIATNASGVATVTSWTLGTSAGTNNNTLQATSTGLTGSPVTFTASATAGIATKLAFSVQPANVAAASAISPSVAVQILDASNNLVSSTASVTIAIGTNPGSSTLGGTTTVAAVGGVATFSNLTLNKTGTGYTLTAAATGLTGATSAAFNVTAGAANKVVFAQQPTTAVAGASISPAVTLQIEDANNNVVTTSSANVTVAIGTNPGGGTLSGTLTVAASGGVATFSNLSINKTGTGYTLTAASSGLTGATSSGFNITPGSATKVVLGQQPTSATAGASISPSVTVQVQDANSNVVTGSSASVTVAIGTNPGGGTLSGTLTVAASSGVATFSNLSIDKAGNGYTLTAASSGLTGATSSSFNITAGAATHLSFLQQPTNTGVNAAITPAVEVQLLDAFGNLVTTTGTSITLAIGTDPSGGTALLIGGSATTSGGIANFNGLKIDMTGAGYTLVAASSGLTGATSTAFDIN